MSEVKFTPGPWKWARLEEQDSADYHYLIGADGKPIHSDGSAGGEYGPDIDVNGPDAHLIATSPDMFEALECSADVARLREVAHMGDEFHAICDKWADRIESVVGEHYPLSERFPGWRKDALISLANFLRDAALTKARGEAQV